MILKNTEQAVGVISSMLSVLIIVAGVVSSVSTAG